MVVQDKYMLSDVGMAECIGQFGWFTIMADDGITWTQVSLPVESEGIRSATKLEPSAFMDSATCARIIHQLLPIRLRDTTNQAEPSKCGAMDWTSHLSPQKKLQTEGMGCSLGSSLLQDTT